MDGSIEALSREAVKKYVGARIRERRIMLGMTQQQVADSIGVTYQQQHKYERGVNAVSADRLHQMAQILHVAIPYFYEGLGGPVPQKLTPHQRLLLELNRIFVLLDEGDQKAVSELAHTLARNQVAHH